MPKSQFWLLIAIIFSVVLAIFFGWKFGETMTSVAWLGTMFLNALKMLIVPLVFTSMVTGIAGLGDIRNFGKLGKKTVLYYLSTTMIAVTIGIILVNIIQPGAGVQPLTSDIPDRVQNKSDFSFVQVLVGLFPPNIFQAMANTDLLPVIIFALVFGGLLSTQGEDSKSILNVFSVFNDVLLKMVQMVLFFAPIGIFGLIAGRLGLAGGGDAVWADIISIGKYTFTVILGLFIHGYIVLPLIYLVLCRKMNPYTYIKGIATALTTAFATASSAATLPLTMKVTQENNKVDKKYVNFVLPLGATVNMDGTALYEAVAAIFIAQVYGIELSAGQQVLIFLTANLAAIGAAGIPEAGLITMIMVLNAVGLPLEGTALLLSIDWLLDRFRTSVNVMGDSLGSAVLEKLDEKPA